MKLAVPALIWLASLAAAARADSWAPYGQRFDIAENGKHFIVLGPIDYEEGTTAFAIYKRKDGTKPPHAVEDRETDESKVVVDAGDRLLKKGSIKQRPLDVWMLSRTPRAILFDEYGRVGRQTILSLLQSDGNVKWRVALDDLEFDREEFSDSTSSTWWSEAWWVDEARGRIVLVAKGHQYRSVEMETGKIHVASVTEILDALKSASPRVRHSFVWMCATAEEKPKGWAKLVLAFRDDESRPLVARIEAAWALRGEVEDDQAVALFKEAQEHLDDEGVRVCVLRYAADLLEAEDGIALTVALLLAHPRWRTPEVAGLLGRSGGPGIEALGDIASDDDRSLEQRVAALIGLREVRTAHAAAAFAFALRYGDEKLAAPALRGFDDQINPPLNRALAAALKREGAGDAAIAEFLGKNARPDFVDSLEVALKRAKPGSKAHATIEAALKKCRSAPQ